MKTIPTLLIALIVAILLIGSLVSNAVAEVQALSAKMDTHSNVSPFDLGGDRTARGVMNGNSFRY